MAKAFENGRYMVLVEENSATSAVALNKDRESAWAIARRFRDEGHRSWIMRVDGERPECVVAVDEPLD